MSARCQSAFHTDLRFTNASESCSEAYLLSDSLVEGVSSSGDIDMAGDAFGSTYSHSS